MYTVINKLSYYLNKAVEIVVILLISALTIMTAIGIIARYVTGQPVIWLYETTVVTFSWAVFLGMSVAFKMRDHIALDIITKHIPRKFKKGFMILLTS